ncbi:MAG: nucleoside triphosphate pyrophosphohydrolase [Nanoarchaeota archaeon]|nr:nucleoside triphosphate pyrophosphohydrolase [Nanoarchaeota archaeon]
MRQTKKPKLVRDNIPEIIFVNGGKCKFRILSDNDKYYSFLIKKLDEEVCEYKDSNNPDELCDILEVIHAIADYHGVDFKDIEKKRKQKLKERGGFKKRIVLEDW